MPEIARNKNTPTAVGFAVLCLFSAGADLAQDSGPVGVGVAVFAVLLGIAIPGLILTTVLRWDEGYIETSALFFKRRRVELDQLASLTLFVGRRTGTSCTVVDRNGGKVVLMERAFKRADEWKAIVLTGAHRSGVTLSPEVAQWLGSSAVVAGSLARFVT